MSTLLMSPGPTMVPQRVLSAGAEQMINHRTPQFSRILHETLDGLKPVFGTRGCVLMMPGSGRMAIEIALMNLFSPGDRVLCAVTGNFGESMAQSARALGLSVMPVCADWTRPADPDEVKAAFRSDPELKALLVVHCETGSSVINDLASLAAVCREYDRLIMVDGVSSVGGMAVNMDELGVDVVVTGSQKCLMAPPGLGLVALRPEAWHYVDRATYPRYTLDFRRMREMAERPEPQTPGTTPVSLVKCLREALRIFEEQSLDTMFATSEKVARATRAAIKALGLSTSPNDPWQKSPTVTTVHLPAHIDVNALRESLFNEYDLHVGSGLGKYAKSTFRIGHMGTEQTANIIDALDAIERCLAHHGWLKHGPGLGVSAAREVLSS